jgi:hypothetical protein
MTSHMRRAAELALGGSDDFLETFRGYGWYLDDLVLEPVDGLPEAERAARCRSAQGSLADRLRTYQPEAIVSLLKRIEPIVRAAAVVAGSGARLYGVPFPGNGNQARFHAEMAAIIQNLPRLNRIGKISS